MLRDRCLTYRLGLLRCFLHALPPAISFVILWLVLSGSLRAQEPVRVAPEKLDIQSFRTVPEAFFYLGPFQEVLIGSAGVEYNDNSNLTRSNKISDLSFSQSLSLNSTWVLSHLSLLQFDFTGQLIENFYETGRNLLNFAIPSSTIELKFPLMDRAQVRLYDNFSYVQNPTTDPTATNTANLNSLTNTIGATVGYDLNIAVLSLSGDYTYNSQSGTTAEGVSNEGTTGTRNSYRAGTALTFRLSPTILYGVNTEATRTSGSHDANVNSLNFGGFINGKLSREFDFDLGAGVTLVDTKPAVPLGYYASAAIRYQIDPHWQLLFSGSHDLIFTTGTALTEATEFSLSTQLGLTRFITFTLSPLVNFGNIKSVSPGTTVSTGPYTQFGVEASLAWKPRRRWTTALTYNFTRRESGATPAAGTSNNYIQNTIGFSISYRF